MNRNAPRLVSDLPGVRSSLIEVILLALAVSLGVNMVSGAILTALPSWAAATLGAIVGLLPVVYVVRSRLRPIEHDLEIEGFYVSERDSCTIIEVPGYKLSEKAVEYLNSAFAENPALRRQWESTPTFHDWDFHKPSARPQSARLLQELMEYILLDELSLSLSGYFNRAEFARGRLEQYERDDLPDILLKNRFLELFSRDPADREGFDPVDEGPDGWTVIYSNSSTGGLYSKFELTLPANSTIRRTSGQCLEVSGPAMTVLLSVDTRPFGAGVPYSLLPLYVGRQFSDCRILRVEFSIQVKVRRGLFMKRDDLRYLGWIEKALQDLDDELSGAAFVERIRWESIEASHRVFREGDRRPPETTAMPDAEGEVEAGDGS
ncbi:hypothetical protein GCM10009600_08950 [Oerskovia paurometabola]